MSNARDIIKRPVITEKTADLMENKKYTFDVDVRANKTQIKDAIEEIFEVKVDSVNTVNYKGKSKRFGRYTGLTPKRKKAFVQLTADSKELDFFEA
ncbi:large subunit ribosomal protein L23 [Alkalihalobacillus xiaoxiensis]|uniref:Large ribosomal subunit protein uL23 n=1 Tax=Shouchella xiaoxiensis TaxID=766895 RepID=A0ABS2T0C9_9BACI|nr:50S ribosomal protein L23 [Shouchella xiaoxiensis]MBM7840901.1 large subunit ribosomal protein L23 [Shouchella xiaoxiensis]